MPTPPYPERQIHLGPCLRPGRHLNGLYARDVSQVAPKALDQARLVSSLCLLFRVGNVRLAKGLDAALQQALLDVPKGDRLVLAESLGFAFRPESHEGLAVLPGQPEAGRSTVTRQNAGLTTRDRLITTDRFVCRAVTGEGWRDTDIRLSFVAFGGNGCETVVPRCWSTILMMMDAASSGLMAFCSSRRRSACSTPTSSISRESSPGTCAVRRGRKAGSARRLQKSRAKACAYANPGRRRQDPRWREINKAGSTQEISAPPIQR